MTEQLPILVNRIQYAAKQSIQDSIISQMKMLRNSISDRKLFVLNEPELKCNVLTDHEHPKNVLPLFNDFINQAEITLLQQPFDKFINDVNNLITEQFTYYQEQQKAYNELNDKYLQTVNRLQYVNDKLNKIMETIIMENQTDKNKLLQQISMLQEQLYGKRITQIYQPDFAPVGQQSQSANKNQNQDSNLLMMQMQSKQQLEKIGQLTAQIQSLQTQMAQLKQENINRTQSGMAANDNIKQLQQQIEQYQQKEEEFLKQENFIRVIQDQLEKKDGQIFEKDTKISELNDEVAKLNQIINENEKFASSGQKEMAYEIDQKTKQLNKLHEQCTQLQDKLKQVRAQNDEFQNQIASLKSENQELKSSQQQSSDSSGQTQKALQQKDNEIKKLNDQITKLKQQVTEMMMGSTKLAPKKSGAGSTQVKPAELRPEVNEQEVQTNITTIGGYSEGFDMDTMSGSSNKFQVTQNQDIMSINGQTSQQEQSNIDQDKLSLSGAQQGSILQNGQNAKHQESNQAQNWNNGTNKSSQKQNTFKQQQNKMGSQTGQGVADQSTQRLSQSSNVNQKQNAVSTQKGSIQGGSLQSGANINLSDDRLDINQLNEQQFESPDGPVPSNTDVRHIHMIQQNQLIQEQEQQLFDNISPQRRQLGDLQQQMIQQQHTIDELQKLQDVQSQQRISESIQKQNDTIVQYKQLLKEITKQDQQALIEAEEQLRGIMNHVDKQTQTDVYEHERVGSAKTYEQYKDTISKQLQQSSRASTNINTAQMGQQRGQNQHGALDSSRSQNFQTLNKNKIQSNRLLNSEADVRSSGVNASGGSYGGVSRSQLDFQGNNRQSGGSLSNTQGYERYQRTRHSYHYNGLATSSDDEDRYMYNEKKRNPYSGKVKKPHMLLMNPQSINNQDNDKLLQRELDKQTALKVVNNILARHGMKAISANDVISVEDVYAQLQRKKNQFTTYFMQQKSFYKPPQRLFGTQSVINLGDVMKAGQNSEDTVVITTSYFRKTYELVDQKLVEMDKSAEKELKVDIRPQDRHGQKVFRKTMLQQRLGPEIQKQVQQFGINGRQNQLVLDGANLNTH